MRSSKNTSEEARYKEVEPLLTGYVTEHPKSSWGWYALGYCQFGQQKVGESIKSLSKSLQLDIRNAEAHKILGRDLMLIGRFDAAQVELSKGFATARSPPKSTTIWESCFPSRITGRMRGRSSKRHSGLTRLT